MPKSNISTLYVEKLHFYTNLLPYYPIIKKKTSERNNSSLMPRTLHIQNEPENEMKNEISGLFFKKK